MILYNVDVDYFCQTRNTLDGELRPIVKEYDALTSELSTDNNLAFISSGDILDQFPPLVMDLIARFDGVVAGGSLRQFFSDDPSRDIDVFFKTEDAYKEAQSYMLGLSECVKIKPYVVVYEHTHNELDYEIQIIFVTEFKYPHELLNSFDMNANKIALYKQGTYPESVKGLNVIAGDKNISDYSPTEDMGYFVVPINHIACCFYESAVHDALRKIIDIFKIDRAKFIRICRFLGKGWTLANDNTRAMVVNFKLTNEAEEVKWSHYEVEALRHLEEIPGIKQTLGGNE